MPFRLHGAPVTVERLMDQVLYPHRKYAAAYIGNVVVFSSTWREHVVRLLTILQSPREARLTANLGPEYLFSLLTCYVPAHKLRSSDSGLFVIPKQKCTTLGERSFSFMAPTLRNSYQLWCVMLPLSLALNQLSRPTCSLLLSMLFKPDICD
ncbi:UNVERIFIED_CONTAM: hypothetical protein FKN15_030445 [Acipenser sinensis]